MDMFHPDDVETSVEAEVTFTIVNSPEYMLEFKL